ncbi:unnamed protein product [Eruca vesicaria subsp. sativa]|uniref:Uncharacterized protein n=1 Tax=Eruca vesicaria subsp. sativa TaxID=29727 RepID=A0ABC8K8P3_ERUVS|nr:unnamed protein product [Eruca vesicaria subsp. sativa]
MCVRCGTHVLVQIFNPFPYTALCFNGVPRDLFWCFPVAELCPPDRDCSSDGEGLLWVRDLMQDMRQSFSSNMVNKEIFREPSLVSHVCISTFKMQLLYQYQQWSEIRTRILAG